MKPRATRRRLPPLNALRAFEAAARHGSFKDAAEELSVSQSAISHQVRGLEDWLGVELFERRTRAVELTPAARLYYPVLREAFDRILEGTEALLAPRAQDVLTVHVYSTFTIRWLFRRLPAFQRRHPGVQLRLATSQEDVDFGRDDVDAGILIGQPANPEVQYDYLFSCELFPVCSPAWLATHGEPPGPAALRAPDLLQVYPSERDWWTWLDAQGVQGVSPAAGPQFDSYELALTAAVQGIGIALGQQPYVQEDLAAGRLIELFPGRRVPNPNRWYLGCRRERAATPRIAALRAWLLEEIAADTGLIREAAVGAMA